MDLNLSKIITASQRWKAPINRLGSVKLDLNENVGIFGNKFIEKFRDFDSTILNCYPEYDAFLKQLSDYTSQPIKNLVLTNGGDQGIDVALHLLFDKNSKVVLPSPIFSMYDHVLATIGCSVVHVPYIDKESYFEFPFEQTLKELSGSQGLILCNPNNPLGYSIEKEKLFLLLDKTQELNIPCILDEAYFEYYGKTYADQLTKYRNLIIIRTFSKVFGLAGLRLGYILANDYICKELLKIRGPWDVNHFAIFVGSIILNDKNYFLQQIDSFRVRKEAVVKLFKNKKFTVYDTSTNFLVVRCENIENIVNQLKEAGILVSDISDYPFGFGLLKNTARIAIPSENDLPTLEKALDKLQ